MKKEINDTDLRKIQLIQLEMLREVDRICKKCNIHYNIIAGTLLGAVRHKGFIPWDDDADVAMERFEYERFRKACATELNKDKFYFQDHRNTKGYRWGYGKLRRKNTLFLRENQEDMPYDQGIFIDIFPLDSIPDNYILRSLFNLEAFVMRKCLWSKVGKKADKSPVKRFVYMLLDKIDDRVVFLHYHSMIRRCQKKYGNSRMVRIITYPTPNNEWGYLKCWYKNSCEIEFEGYMFLGIKDYDSYLTFKFGEYMILPDLNHRKIHPVSDLQLTE